MSKKVRRRKTVHYKRVQFTNTGANLQEYLSLAFSSSKKPVDRVEFLDEKGSVRRVVNSTKSRSEMIFGQMIRFEPGRDQTVVVLDEDSDEYPVEQITVPPRDDGKKREVIESVLYFGVLENHVILIQSAALKSRDFEKHIEWLIKHNTKVFPEDCAIFLSDQPTESARKKIENLPVKKVLIGAGLESKPEESQGKISATNKVKFRPDGKGFDILEAALGEEWRKDLSLEESLDESNLRVSLEVTYFRKTTKRANEMLDNIATAMRHAEPDDVRIELQGGTVLKGDELKMTGYINVDTYNGIADSNDLYTEMLDWLKGRIQEGTVE